MNKEVIVKLHDNFEEMVQTETETGSEFWLARDLQPLLGYTKWENCAKVIEKAKTSCINASYMPENHFFDVRKMITLGIELFMIAKSPLTLYALSGALYKRRELIRV